MANSFFELFKLKNLAAIFNSIFFSAPLVPSANPIGMNFKINPEFNCVSVSPLPSFRSDTFVWILTIAQETDLPCHSSALVSSVCFQHSSQTHPIEWKSRPRHSSVQNPLLFSMSSWTLPFTHEHTTPTLVKGILSTGHPSSLCRGDRSFSLDNTSQHPVASCPTFSRLYTKVTFSKRLPWP